MTTLDRRPSSTIEETERPASQRHGYAAAVLGAVLIVAGGLWFLDVIDAVELRAAVVLPVILAVVGLALMAGSWDGPHTGLVMVGVFLTAAVLAAAVAPPNAFRGGVGQRTFTVTETDALAPRYDVGVGDLRLDLSGLSLLRSTEVDVTVGAGELRIQLPSDTPVRVDAAVGAGQIDLLGDVRDGISVTDTYTSETYDTADVRLMLDLDVAAGNIEVER